MYFSINALGAYCLGLTNEYAAPKRLTSSRLSLFSDLRITSSLDRLSSEAEFLQSNDDQPLPETVESFIQVSDRQARALRDKGATILVECVDKEVRELIATHKLTQNFCMLAGDKHLVVLPGREEQFRKAIRTIGFGMPKEWMSSPKG